MRPALDRIEVALGALRYCQSVELGGLLDVSGSTPQRVPPRELIDAELALRRTSLEVLRNYIAGEIDVHPRCTAESNAHGEQDYVDGAPRRRDEDGRG